MPASPTWLPLLASLVSTTQTASTVILMRHCARSMTQKILFGAAVPGFQVQQDYAADPWPAWPVPEIPIMSCLPRGLDLVEGVGSWVRAEMPLPGPVVAVADDAERTQATGRSFLRGLGLDEGSLLVDHAPFSSNHTDPKCPALGLAHQRALSEEYRASFARQPYPDEAQLRSALTALRRVVGVDAPAGNWTAISGSSFGVMNTASWITEHLLLEWAGGLTVGWGRLEVERELPLLYHLHDYLLSDVMFKGSPVNTGRSVATLSRRMLEAFGRNGTTIFVGHDIDIAPLGVVLDLKWDAKPWRQNTTLPGSMLRFDIDDQQLVRASYIYPTSFADPTSAFFRREVGEFGGVGQAAHISELWHRVIEKTISECVVEDVASVGKARGEKLVTIFV